MTKRTILVISASIIIGFTILGAFVCYGLFNSQRQKDTARYQMITHGDTVIIFDQSNGTFWEKYIPQNEGPTDWKKSESPIK